MPRESRQDSRSRRRSTRFKVTRADQPIYLQIMDAIRQQIVSGKLAAGETVPSVRQMSHDLGVAPATVNRALRALVEQGVLTSHVGSGTQVAVRRGRRTGTLGLIGAAPFTDVIRGPYFNHLLLYLQSGMIRSGWTVAYGHCPPETRLTTMFNHLRLVDGVFILGSQERAEDQLLEVARLGTPVMLLGGLPKPAGVLYGSNDNIGDSARAVRALIRRGHQKIACVGYDVSFYRVTNEIRITGYRQGMAEAKLPVREDQIILDSLDRAADRLLALPDPPTALLILSGMQHFGTLADRLRGTPLELGTKLYVCAYDENLWHSIAAHKIPHMFIEQPLAELCERAVDLMTRLIESPDVPMEDICLPSRLVEVTADGFSRAVDPF